MLNLIRSILYLFAALFGDANAIRKGRVGRRIARRATERVMGKTFGKLFK